MGYHYAKLLSHSSTDLLNSSPPDTKRRTI